MLVNLPFLLFALLLLWFPRQWLRLGVSVMRRRTKSPAEVRRAEEPWNQRERGDPRVDFRGEFGKVRNHVDWLRGGAGSLAVMGGLGIEPCLGLAENAGSVAGRELFVAKLGILLVGLLIQTVRYEKSRFMFFAPIFFLCGLSVGLCGVKGAFFAFAMIWALNPMLGSPQGFLAVYAMLMLGFGLLFLGIKNKLPVVALVYCLLPVLLSLLAHRPLVLFSKKGSRTHGP